MSGKPSDDSVPLGVADRLRNSGPPARSIRAIEVALAVALFLVATVGFVSYAAIQSFDDVADTRRRAFEISAAFEEVLSLIADAETGQRGYLITGRDEYLEPYANARARIEEAIANVRRLAVENGMPAAATDRLAKLSDEKFLELADTIGLRRSNGFDAAAAMVLTDRGREKMKEIRSLVADMRTASTRLVAYASGDLHRQIVVASAFGVFANLIALGFVFFSGVVVRRDLGEKARREAELSAQLIDTADAIILVRDRDGAIVFYNRFMEELSGRPLAGARGENWSHAFVPQVEKARMREIFDHVVREGEAKGYVCPLLSREGLFRDIEWHTKALRDSTGAVIGVVSTGHDVTERRLAQRQAFERSRLADIGAVTAKVAHDIGNPISAMSMQVQLMSRYVNRGEPLQALEKPIQQLGSEMHRVESLIRELLSFAREQRLDLTDVEIPSLLREVADMWQPLAASHRVSLSVAQGDDPPRVRADESKLHRVLDNLVKNAIEAVGDGPGEIILMASSPSADTIRISVDDDGPGVPETVDVFRLFATTKQNGSGLGLAVSKQIIQAHGGNLHFAKRNPRGTTFVVDLPRQQPSA